MGPGRRAAESYLTVPHCWSINDIEENAFNMGRTKGLDWMIDWIPCLMDDRWILNRFQRQLLGTG